MYLRCAPSRIDTSRALREFGWKARIGFEEGLRETVEWFEKNRAG